MQTSLVIAKLPFEHERLKIADYDPQRAASRSKLRQIHPGNRFRLMVGLPLVPEPSPEEIFPSHGCTKPSDFLDGVNDDDL